MGRSGFLWGWARSGKNWTTERIEWIYIELRRTHEFIQLATVGNRHFIRDGIGHSGTHQCLDREETRKYLLMPGFFNFNQSGGHFIVCLHHGPRDPQRGDDLERPLVGMAGRNLRSHVCCRSNCAWTADGDGPVFHLCCFWSGFHFLVDWSFWLVWNSNPWTQFFKNSRSTFGGRRNPFDSKRGIRIIQFIVMSLRTGLMIEPNHQRFFSRDIREIRFDGGGKADFHR